MPEIIETTVYQLHELSEAAKDKARAWYRDGGFDHDWYDAVYADFEEICAILGIALRTSIVRLLGGGTREEPCIFFRGFWSQGDGACFERHYAHVAQARAKIRAYAPQDFGLHQIADALQATQQRNFYQLRASIRHRGHYTHEYCMEITVERASPTGQDMTHDAEAGLETLVAESFVVTDRRAIYTHTATGAETRLLSITQRERNRPIALADALAWANQDHGRLLVNARSGRAAVQVSAPSLMLDDGEIERRVRLIRPMEAHHASLAMMADSHWEEVDPQAFAHAWTCELADVPPFTDSTIHIVAGLLLPVWKRLPNESTRVYRLQTDDGERIIGRRVSPAWVATAASLETMSLSADEAYAALLDGRTLIDLAEGLQLRRVRVMGAHRIELLGFTEAMCERLRAYGLFTEIIAWKLRFFVPIGTHGPSVLARLLDTYPIQRLSDREAA